MKATPFSRLLVANRGEIAVRVMRSARRLGLATVAVHSSADADAPHVRAADQAVAIGGARPAESYLSIPALLDAARRSGADAVHPGYGFLAENAAFAGACREAGLVFIGPSAEAIESMGDKAAAKRLMRAAGVPCIAGHDDAGSSDAHLAAAADALGYPVMIKATAGGGGGGMRLVTGAADFAAALASARSEAQGAFGSGAVILERALTGARHIEIQIFADRQGHVVHLGERDCSVQRRHQKLIEEAPSPAVDAALRERLGATAVAAAQAIGYEGAGTIEFLLDRDGDFHFIEMNPRLQVEHPVTEAVTGLDLVEWQLRIAAGQPLPLAQPEIRFEGHAIEARLCAEDPAQGFLPQSGRLALWLPPSGVRIEHALHSGIEIAPHYDSMIAKVIAHGHDREAARRALHAALESLVALGVPTNREYLARCVTHPVFAAGAATTAFVADHADALAGHGGALATDGAPSVTQGASWVTEGAPVAAAGLSLAVAALVLLQSTAVDPRDGRAGIPVHPLAHRLPLPLRFVVDGHEVAALVSRVDARGVAVAIGAQRHAFKLVEQTRTTLRFIAGGVLDHATFVRDADRLWLQHRGVALQLDDRTRAAPPRLDASAGDGRLRAAMNGRVVAVLARLGDPVAAGRPLVTIEAMKMEHVHSAARAGTVTVIGVAPGAQVAAGQLLLEID